MNKLALGITAGCLSALILLSGGDSAKAAGLGTEQAMAGFSVALNNYSASTLTPDAELKELVQPANIEQAVEQAAAMTTEEETEANPYASIAISQVADDSYVNIRSGPSTSSEIVAKIYNNCAATIISEVEGEDGTWYHIRSGNATGYIKSDYFVTGEEAQQIAENIGQVSAVVTSTAVRVREEANLDDDTNILMVVTEGSEFSVLENEGDWTKIKIDDDAEGYVYSDCVAQKVTFDSAITIAEEEEEKRLEEERQKEYEEAMKALEEAKEAESSSIAASESAAAAAQAAAEQAAAQAAAQQQAAQQAAQQQAAQQAAAAQAAAAQQAAAQAAAASQAAAAQTAVGSNDANSTQLRNAVVAYAKQFVGNPYVYGGTSLTNGTDCSGFTMSVYAQFGYSLPHYSVAQASCGTQISAENVRPGDLVFYATNGGGISHVAMYIGNGQIIHAANENYGICIWNMYYRTPCAVVSILP